MMDFKDECPIQFEIFQSDMEKIMYNLNTVCTEIPLELLNKKQELAIRQLIKIKDELQHKINYHKSVGEWK